MKLRFLPVTLITISVVLVGTLVTQADITKSGYVASPSLELLEKANSYLDAKDEAAFNKIMATGKVIMLKAGIEVEIVESKLLRGLIKIRPRGQTVELWTVAEAVQ